MYSSLLKTEDFFLVASISLADICGIRKQYVRTETFFNSIFALSVLPSHISNLEMN